jgi:ArsR family transcriptional regulator
MLIYCSIVVELSTTTAQARVKRLVNLGLVDTTCTPIERINQLKSKISEDDRSFRHLEDFFAALGDATRLKMLKIIADEELCSCEVMAALELTQPTTSHHLGILEKAGLLSSRRNGKWVFYKIANSQVKNLITKGFNLVEMMD